jgi:DNA-binding transcriptional MerR regulator
MPGVGPGRRVDHLDSDTTSESILYSKLMAAADRTYRTAAFAARAGVTSRTLHHYDRLGLLKPRRSPAGYRIYTDRDLETLEEIVALRFIGVPLKAIAALRRGLNASFAGVLRAQRLILERRQASVTRAIAAIAAAEDVLRAGASIQPELFRTIIEVMHMETNQDHIVTNYTELLKKKTTLLSTMSDEYRADVRGRWSTLVADFKAALHVLPDSRTAQELLDRWTALLGELTGVDAAAFGEASAIAGRVHASPELAAAVWARRSEWLPPGAATATKEMTADAALQLVRERFKSLVDDDVMSFISRARAARG